MAVAKRPLQVRELVVCPSNRANNVPVPLPGTLGIVLAVEAELVMVFWGTNGVDPIIFWHTESELNVASVADLFRHRADESRPSVRAA